VVRGANAEGLGPGPGSAAPSLPARPRRVPSGAGHGAGSGTAAPRLLESPSPGSPAGSAARFELPGRAASWVWGFAGGSLPLASVRSRVPAQLLAGRHQPGEEDENERIQAEKGNHRDDEAY